MSICLPDDSQVCPLFSISRPKSTSPPELLQYSLTGLLASYLLQLWLILPPPRTKPLKGKWHLLLKILPRLPPGWSWNVRGTYPVMQLLSAMTAVSCPYPSFLSPAIAHPVWLFLPWESSFLFPGTHSNSQAPGKLTLYDPALTPLPLETFPDTFTGRVDDTLHSCSIAMHNAAPVLTTLRDHISHLHLPYCMAA